MRLATTFLLALAYLRGETLQEILNRMDADAVHFVGVKADLKRSDYNPVFKESTEGAGSLTMMRHGKGVSALVEFTAPDVKQLLFRENQFHEYLPKLNLVNEYDMGKSAGAVNQFVTLGFGSTGKELQKNYAVTLRDPEALKIGDKDVKASKIELIPRSAEALNLVKKIEFWIPEGKSYAVQLKIYQKSGDTNTVIYTSVQVNPPGLTEHSIALKAPKNAKHEKINK